MAAALPKAGALVALLALAGALASLVTGVGTVALACFALLFFAITAAVDEDPAAPRRTRGTRRPPSGAGGTNAGRHTADPAEAARALKSMMKKP